MVMFAEEVTVPLKSWPEPVVPAVTGPLKVAVAPVLTVICIPVPPELSEPPESIVHCPPESIVSSGLVATLPPLPLMRPPLNTVQRARAAHFDIGPRVADGRCVSVPLTPSVPLTRRSHGRGGADDG